MEFRIEVGVHRAPINEPWEPSTKGREPYILGEIIGILQQKTVSLGGVLKYVYIYKKNNPET